MSNCENKVKEEKCDFDKELAETKIKKKEKISISFKEVRKVISNIKADKGDNRVDIYFLEKLSKQNNYNSFSPEISNNIIKELLNIVEIKINSICHLEQIEYNPSGYINGELELCKKENLGDSYNNLVRNLKSKDHKLAYGIDPEKIHNYVIEFHSNDKLVRIYRRFTKLNKLRKGMLGVIKKNNKFEKIEDSFIGIDDDIDLIEYDDTLIVLNHISLERIFDMELEYRKQAEEALGKIKIEKRIQGFESFREDILDNIPSMKRLTKSFEQNRLPLFFENFSDVFKVSKHFGLGVSFTSDEKRIAYTDRSQLTEITLLMNDSYYKTLIGKEGGTDPQR